LEVDEDDGVRLWPATAGAAGAAGAAEAVLTCAICFGEAVNFFFWSGEWEPALLCVGVRGLVLVDAPVAAAIRSVCFLRATEVEAALMVDEIAAASFAFAADANGSAAGAGDFTPVFCFGDCRAVCVFGDDLMADFPGDPGTGVRGLLLDVVAVAVAPFGI
jgi:hypothetical protein